MKIDTEETHTPPDIALSHLAVGILVFDTENRICWLNPKLEELFGVRRLDLLGESAEDFFVNTVRNTVESADSISETWLSREQRPTTLECHIFARDVKRERWLERYAFPVESGRLTGGRVEYFYDITERKQAKEALNLSSVQITQLTEQQSLLLETMPEFVYRHDREGIFEYISEAVEPITGYALEEWKKHYTTFLTDNPLNQNAIEYTEKTLRTGEINPPYPLEIRHKYGASVMLEVNERPYYEDGAIAGIVGVARDITDRVRAEEENQDIEHQMQYTQKLESLGVLAGGIAHDFNNLLASILSNAGMLLDDLQGDSHSKRNVQEIITAAKHAAGLSHQMLAYSGKGKVVVETIDLNELARDMSKLIVASVSKKARLRYEFARDLPPIEADISQIRQVVVNLLTNAAEALDGQPGTVSITTGICDCTAEDLSNRYLSDPLPEGPYAFVEVQDTGIGMDRDALEKAFDPFFTTKFTGRGLGLAAVLGIVRGHKGSIQVKSEFKQGTTFRVLLPIPESRKYAKPVQKKTEAPNGTETILLVDDDSLLRSSISRMLKRSGFQVIEAADGAAAIQSLDENVDEISCTVLDLTMPDMDGEETLRELLKIRHDLPVIIASGYNEDHLAERFSEYSVSGFVCKPFDSAELLAKLRTALG